MNSHFLLLATFFTCASLHPTRAADGPTEEQLVQAAQDLPKANFPKLVVFMEAKLERVHQANLKAAEPENREALQKAQDAWKKFYEADLLAAASEGGGGADNPITMQRKVYQLRLRIYQLSTPFHQGWVEIPKVEEA